MRGLEVILQILRLGGHFCGDHGASAPPPSSRLCLFMRNSVKYVTIPRCFLFVYLFICLFVYLFICLYTNLIHFFSVREIKQNSLQWISEKNIIMFWNFGFQHVLLFDFFIIIIVHFICLLFFHKFELHEVCLRINKWGKYGQIVSKCRLLSRVYNIQRISTKFNAI